MLTLIGAGDVDDVNANLSVAITNIVNGSVALTGGTGGLGTTFTFTPTANFVGNMTFDYQVSDDELPVAASSAVGTATVALSAVNDAPTVNATAADVGTEDIDQVYTHAQMLTLIGAGDVDDVNANLSVAITNIVNGSVALTGGTGGLGTTFTFTPTSSFVGNMTFDYQVSDDELPVAASSAVGTATVALSAVNDAPTVNATAADVGTEDIDQVYTHAQMLTLVGAGDVDDINANLSVAISNVVNGSVALTGGTGGAGTTFTFTPTANFAGGMTFDYQVSDDELPLPASSAVGTATVTLSAVNDAPTVNATAADVGTEDTDRVYTHAQMLTLIGAGDVDDINANLSVAISNVVNGSVALTGGTGGAGTTFTFTPTANFVGGMTFDYQVSDDQLPLPASSAVGTATVTLTNVNDTPVGVPTITGTVTEDQILTADTSGISDVDGLGAFSYQWLRNGAVIGGATASTHTLNDADVGNLISVRVSYTDGNGTAEGPLTSAQTAAVINVNDAPVGVPTITGTVTEDQILTADTSGISDADGLGAFSYQWLRGGAVIGGATASTYTLGDADVGNQISVRVSYTDGNGTPEGPLTSAQTAAVTNVNDAPVGLPTITGTVTEDQILTADTSGISDVDGLGAFSYQWLRNGAVIGGATASTHTLNDADVGNQMSVRVSYTDGNGTAEGPLTSAQTAAVINVNDAPVGLPTITGTVTEDQILTADTSGISDADGLGAFSYQWLRGGAVIGGATASTYTLGDADVGSQISVRVSYTDGNGTPEGPLTSAQTAAVTNVNDAPVGLPTITGTVTEDQILTADTSGISDVDGLGAFSYQWLRGGAAIGGATASTYTLGDADVGNQISVRANYTDGQGTTENVGSATTAPVVNINDAPIGAANTVTTLQDTAYVFSAGDFGFSDSYDNPANNLLAVRIAALPAAGTLTDNGVAVVAGQFVNVADIDAGWLVFTPANGSNGVAYATFTFQVQDDGAGSDMDLVARALTVSVNAPGVPLPVVSPPPVVDPPLPPVGPGVDPQAASPEDDTETQTETTILAALGGGSTAPESQPHLVSEVHVLTNLSSTQSVRVPEPQGSSHSSTESDDAIAADNWLEFLNSLNSSPTTVQVPGEEVSVILDETDFGDTSDQQFFSLDSGLQLSGVALSAGFVSWAIRGAGLFASMLSSIPAWRHMDPLPVLKEEEKEEEKDWTLRESDDDHATDEDVDVIDLWTPRDALETAWSDTGIATLGSTEWDAQTDVADATMDFLGNVVSRPDSTEPVNRDQLAEEFA
jgi:hypothetical protein